MKLIVMAHKGEAQAFLAKMPSNTQILLTGTGVARAQNQIKNILTKPIKTIINLGFAGSLHPNHPIGSLVQVTEVSYKNNKLLLHKGPKLAPLALCESLDQALLDLSPISPQIIDQELYGIAVSASEARIPLYSFKIISDEPYARSFDKDEFLRKIPVLSQALFDYYKNVIEKNI